MLAALTFATTRSILEAKGLLLISHISKAVLSFLTELFIVLQHIIYRCATHLDTVQPHAVLYSDCISSSISNRKTISVISISKLSVCPGLPLFFFSFSHPLLHCHCLLTNRRSSFAVNVLRQSQYSASLNIHFKCLCAIYTARARGQSA